MSKKVKIPLDSSALSCLGSYLQYRLSLISPAILPPVKSVSQPGKIIPSETTHRKNAEEETEAAIVSQPSKCLKFETFL